MLGVVVADSSSHVAHGDDGGGNWDCNNSQGNMCNWIGQWMMRWCPVHDDLSTHSSTRLAYENQLQPPWESPFERPWCCGCDSWHPVS